MAVVNWETFSDYPAFFGALQSFLGWRGFDQSLKKADGTRRVPRGGPPPPGLVNFARKTKGIAGSEFAAEIDEWVGPGHAGGPAAGCVRHAARPRADARPT